MKLKTTYKLLLPFLVVASIANLVLAVFVYYRFRHPVEYNIIVHEPPSFPSLPPVTNLNPRVGLLGVSHPPFSDSSSVVSSVTSSVDSVRSSSVPSVSMRYHYCVVSGRRVAYLNSVAVHEGDEHAFGVVSRIFPERIYFTDGSYIENIFDRFDDSEFRSADSSFKPSDLPLSQSYTSTH